MNMRKSLIALTLIMALIMAFAIPGAAIKIAPYPNPLHDIMYWDTTSAKLIIQNPEGESLTTSWPSTVDLWNYNGNTWAFDLPTGDKFKFMKEVLIGVEGVPLVYTEGEELLEIWGTSASTSGTVTAMPLYVHSTLTGIGGVGRAAQFVLETNVALGGWSNALKGQVIYGAAGKTAGLGSAICAEMTLSAGTTPGTYAPLEIELNMGAAGVTGTQTSLIYMSVNDAASTTFDDNGFLFSLNGVAAGASDAFYLADLTVTKADGLLKINVNGTAYYLFITTAINGGD